MGHKYPWADLDSPVYVAIQTKQRKKWVVYYAWFCVCLLIAGAILTKFHIMCTVFAVLVALATVTERTEAVTERGLESFIDLKAFTSDELWTWDDIEAITYETNQDVPNTTLLYFTHKAVRTRKAFFKDEDVVMIKVLAKKKNKKINIYDGNEFRAEARAYNAEQDKYRKRRKK